MKAEFSSDGWMRVTMDGQEISVQPTPSNNARQYVHDTMSAAGGQIHSSQWTGWVPGGNCQGGGDLDGSVFTVSNVTIMGAMVQGKEPPPCADV